MLGGPPGAPYTASESRDGVGSGDNNKAFDFGQVQTVASHPKFTTMTFARLLCLKSHIEAGDRVYVEPPHITAIVE